MREPTTVKIDCADLEAEIHARLGICPSFYLAASNSPQLMEQIWRNAESWYFDNPLPSLFKEKLCVMLSRYGKTPYSVAWHAASLAGRFPVAGDVDCTPLDVSEVEAILRAAQPSAEGLTAQLDQLLELSKSGKRWESGSGFDLSVLSCALPLFLSGHALAATMFDADLEQRCRQALKAALGPSDFDQLLLLLSFCHVSRAWEAAHPELEIEDEVQEWLAENESLRLCISTDFDTESRAMTSRSEAAYETERFLTLENELLAEFTRGLPVAESLLRLVEFVDAQADDVVTSILLLDENEQLVSGAGPGLPDHYHEAINGISIGDGAGSCGTAAFRAESVFVEDIATHPYWADFKDLALPIGLRACWSSPIIGPQGEVLGTFAIYRRIPGPPEQRHLRLIEAATHLASLLLARERSETELRQSEARFRSMFEQAAVGVAFVDSDTGRLRQVNERFSHILGYESQELSKRTLGDITHPDDRDSSLEAARQLRAGEISEFSQEIRYLHRDGSIVWGNVTVSQIEVDGRSLPWNLTIVEDVTARKRAQLNLQESESRFRILCDRAPVGIFMNHADGGCSYVNEACSEILDLELESALGAGWCRSIHEEDRERVMESWQSTVDSGRNFAAEYRFRRSDGSIVWVQGDAKPRRGGDGEIIGFIGTVVDITDRKRAERELRASEDRFRRMLDSLPELIWLSGRDKACTWFNESWLAFTGREMFDELGDGWMGGIHPEDVKVCRRDFDRAFETREAFGLEYRRRHHDGSYRWVLDCGQPLLSANGEFEGYIGGCVDIQQRRDAEDERESLQVALQHAQKLEAIGTLASGVAHDFNNVLTAIQGFADLALLDVHKDSQAGGYLLGVKRATQQARGVTDGLLTFARKGHIETEAVELTKLVRESLELLRRLLPFSIEMDGDIPDSPIWVNADRTQLHQVLTNLVVNARDAMPNGGCITVDVSCSENLDGSVLIQERDNGCGMDEETLARVFEPFFTTKPYGKGTGLGLAVIHGVVTAHGGTLELESREGEGTVVSLQLPLTSPPSALATQSEARRRRRGRGELVFLVEDNEFVRESLSSVIAAAGYRSVVAEDGLLAVDVFRDQEDVRVAVVDLDLPGQNGVRCVDELRRLQAGLPVVYVSGNPDNPVRGLIAPGDVLLAKPFDFEILLQKIDEALNA